MNQIVRYPSGRIADGADGFVLTTDSSGDASLSCGQIVGIFGGISIEVASGEAPTVRVNDRLGVDLLEGKGATLSADARIGIGGDGIQAHMVAEELTIVISGGGNEKSHTVALYAKVGE